MSEKRPPNPAGNPDAIAPWRWRPGQSGNPGGKTAEQKRLEMENAERATHIRNRLLEAMTDEVDDLRARVLAGDPAARRELNKILSSDTLTLLRDSEMRGLGAPMQQVEITERNKPDEDLLADAKQELVNAGIPEEQAEAIIQNRLNRPE